MRPLLLAACLASFSLAACGGATTDLFLTSGPDDGGTVKPGDAATDSPSIALPPPPTYAPGCPLTPPADGSSCNAGFGLTCEYGADTHCTTMATCASENSNGTFVWFVTTPDPSCSGNPSSCAPTFAKVHVGGACPLGDSCTYPEGRCGCGSCETNTPNQGTQWQCETWDTPASCPEPRPLLGTACSNDGQACAYGSSCCSTIDIGPAMLCQAGYWVENGSDPCECGSVGLCGQ